MKKLTATVLAFIFAASAMCGCSSGFSEADREFSRGSWAGGCYSSDYIGLEFALPDGWSAASDETIADMMELGEDALTDEETYLKALSEVKMIYDMMAYNADFTANVMVMFENLSLTTGGTDYDEESYSANVASQLSETYADAGITREELGYVSLAGQKFYSQAFTMYDGQFECRYFYRRTGDYMCVITYTGLVGIQPGSSGISECFSAV